MTAELEALKVKCEELEDQVGEESHGRNEEKARVNSALREW